nr:hypothetical protein Iba_chr11aCG4700 [Ipomoea batatas]
METRQLSGLSYEFAIVLWHGEDLSLYIFFIPEFWGLRQLAQLSQVKPPLKPFYIYINPTPIKTLHFPYALLRFHPHSSPPPSVTLSALSALPAQFHPPFRCLLVPSRYIYLSSGVISFS